RSDHTAQLSFPTRRSSDLPVSRGRIGPTGSEELAIHGVSGFAPCVLEAEHHVAAASIEINAHERGDSQLIGVAVFRRSVLGADLDRKSTRLNSSHVKISYA